MDLSVLDEWTGEVMDYRQLRKHPNYAAPWTTSNPNDVGRLRQGTGRNTEGTGQLVEGTDTFFIVHYNEIPANRRKEITYTSVLCEVRPQKEDRN